MIASRACPPKAELDSCQLLERFSLANKAEEEVCMLISIYEIEFGIRYYHNLSTVTSFITL